MVDSKIFSVRIVSIDYYMAPPIPDIDFCYSSFQGGKVNKVPVIRIFGSTPSGQRACLHIHRALPYLFVPFADLTVQLGRKDDASPNFLCVALEEALKLTSSSGSKRQHVHGCCIVQAKKLYGYHSSEELFVKVYFYYPHDVSRAANVLLGSTVLNKRLQPYESHIPFLLQFMIDYNLYGMGLVHISKLKFRHPVPDFVSSGRVGSESGQETTKVTFSPFDKKEISSCEESLTSPVWTSSTIPSDCFWQFSHEPGEANHFSHLVKRQSTCELEVDSTVDEIFNQQLKMYSSFSQAVTDVRMVQSLIPIWEEEFERTGIHELKICSDPGKPLSEDVLKILSHGLGNEVKLSELVCKLETSSISFETQQKFVESLGTSFARTEVVGHEDVKSCNKDRDPLESLRAKNVHESLLSQNTLFEDVPTATHSEKEDIDSYLFDGIQSELTETLTQKGTDKEALGLLKWLASSQAVEEINTDDELVCETILSPLLPASTIDKVLEKASKDYESESQQECQDILDSITIVNYEKLEENFLPVSHKISPNEPIPQLNVSGDNQYRTASNDLFEIKINSESDCPFQYHQQQDASTIHSNRYKRKKPLWGSIPFSFSQKFDDEVQPVKFNMASGSGTKASSSGRMEAEKCADGLLNTIESGFSDSKEVSSLVGCSVRELMRKKRCLQFDSPGCKTHKFENFLLEEVQKESAFIGPQQCEFLTTENCIGNKCPLGSSILRPQRKTIESSPILATFEPEDLALKDENVSISGILGNETGASVVAGDRTQQTSFADSISGNERVDDMTSSSSYAPKMSVRNGEKLTDSTTLLFERFGNGQGYKNNCLYMPGTSVFQTNMVGDYGNSVFMRFLKKPPKINFTDGTAELFLQSPAISTFSLPPVQGQGTDEFLPFFVNREVKVHDVFHKERDLNFHHGVMGVPSYFQNDGSLLYILSPFSSPPSSDIVSNWLNINDMGTLKEDCDEGLVDPFSWKNKDFLSSLMAPEGSHVYGCSRILTKSGCTLANPVLNQHDNKKPQGANKNTKDLSDDLLYAFHDKENHLKVMNCSGSLQDISQITGPDGKLKSTPVSQMGFRDPASLGGGQQLMMLSIEIQAECRGDLRPDPQFDSINVIVLAVHEDSDNLIDVFVFLRGNTVSNRRYIDGISGCKEFFIFEEKQLLEQFISIICSFDPDIIMGWDIQGGSLGFLAERASHFGINLISNISRVPSVLKNDAESSKILNEGFQDDMHPESFFGDPNLIEDEWGRTHASGIHVGGRVVLNVWRLMRSEIKLNLYTVEAVAESVLRRKVPFINNRVLMTWYLSGPGKARYRCIEYVIDRAKLNLEIINQHDLINRTSELARIFGIDFFSVLSRGSQYRVESMLLRLTHAQNYLAISPGNHQVASQPAMECLPLVMEPESGFYPDPVIVLDFQSLYPSMVIAYNLCFCTCLGKISPSKENVFGVTSFSPDPCVLQNLKQQLLLTPNGVMYVPSGVRKGILPRLLEEILSTRIMVKQAMKKLDPSQQVLQRIFNARQLALKLIANVTYGYTAAGFSGRMPCAELADSIVQCGRKTLENAISFINAHDKWNARVVYGDTDSMFVLLKGRTLKESFEIGQEIASAITSMNPDPVTLKFEKVYHPCFLLTKKRYVGYSYERPDQMEGVFDAKGIETVRRDTCGAVSKILEHSLRLFFQHQDLLKVKLYIERQWTRILSNRVSLQDFIFAKEVRLGTYSTRGSSLPPGAIVATKAMKSDPRAEPRYAERIPYIVIHGSPGARLADMVVDPSDLLALDSPLRLNELYYINKQIIPALQRVFGLVGCDPSRWFSEMPRPLRESYSHAHRTRIDYYYLSKHCVLCGGLVPGGAHICDGCSGGHVSAATALIARTSKLEGDLMRLNDICRHCGGGDWVVESGVKCSSLACSVFFQRRRVQKKLRSVSDVSHQAGLYPKCNVEWF